MYVDDDETQFFCRECGDITDVEDESPDTFVCEICYCNTDYEEDDYEFEPDTTSRD